MDGKRILIEFIGGDMDGRTLDSHSSDEYERLQLDNCLAMSRNGTVGRGFHGVSMTAMEAMIRREMEISDLNRSAKGTHQYTVVERLEEGDEVLIRMKYSVRPLERVTDGEGSEE